MEIDPGIKGLLALILGIAACFCDSGWGVAYFTVFLLMVTLWLKCELRFVAKNLASFAVILGLPYVGGLLLSGLMSHLVPGTQAVIGFTWQAVAFKMVKIFFIWYISSLYFFTTPFLAIAEMLGRLLAPLNAWGIPVNKHLHMILCIVQELTRSVGQFTRDVMEQARLIFKNNELGLGARCKELAHILAGFIANSLQQTDHIQAEYDGIGVPGVYRPNIVRNEILAMLSSLIFLLFFFTKV